MTGAMPMGSQSAPSATNEARIRWVQRAGDTVSEPATYWDHAWPLRDHALDADEARYVPSHDVILVRKDSAITTVIANDTTLRGAARDAIRRARREYGGNA